MPYIVRTDGAGKVEEIRPGTAADIPEGEANWWLASEVHPSGRGPTASIRQDGSVDLVWPGGNVEPAWQAMELRQYAAEVRWRKTQGGLTLPNGVRIDTSDASQDKITQTLLILERGWQETIGFKAATGFVTLDLAAMTGIAQAVAAHVQACFAAEKECLDAIAAGTVTTRADVDGWPWP